MYKILLLLLISISALNANVSIDSVKSNIGEHVKLSIIISDYTFKNLNEIAFNFELSNPTVFYPDSITCDIPDRLLIFHNLGNGKYEVAINNIKGAFISGSLVITIHGEMLAGYDSICYVTFPFFRINDNEYKDLNTVVYSKSLGTPLPYIRRSALSINSPNPVIAGNSTEWGFRTDAPIEVTFWIYELSGRLLEKIDYGLAEPGMHKFVYSTAATFAAGTYLITMITPVSHYTRFFSVIK